MAFAHVGAVGNANSKLNNQSSIAMNVDNTVEVGNIIILSVAKDNINTTFEDHNEFTSVTDSQSNTWIKARERTNAANFKASTVGAIFYSQVDTELVGATDTITVNFEPSNRNDASAVIADEFTFDTSKVFAPAGDWTQAQADNADLPSLSVQNLDNVEHLLIYGGMKENTGITYTATANGEALFTSSPAETTGGTATTNQSVMSEWRIATLTTWSADPSDDTDADCIGLAVAFDEAEGGPVNAFDHLSMMHNS